MKILLAVVFSYMLTSGWACLLGGYVALIWVSVVFIPPAIGSVLVADAQREKYRHEDQYLARVAHHRAIDANSRVVP
jgi:hypothetical protein